MLGMLGLLGVRGGTMKINSDIQKIIDSKAYECAGGAEVAAKHAGHARGAVNAGSARYAWYARYVWYVRRAWYARNTWGAYENQF